ncbi:MAG: DUF4339 domain-containing protein [Verrucomicrobia bacterium]|nr:DUF4339 domain-containing protein [Verrucomicrobiota bacterium]
MPAYYLYVDNRVQGPYSEAEVKTHFDAGTLQPDTPVCADGGEWRRLADTLPYLFPPPARPFSASRSATPTKSPVNPHKPAVAAQTANYSVRPGYKKGGKESFTRIASPCEFDFKPGEPPNLKVNYYPPSNWWLACLATFVTGVVVKAGVLVVGPGIIVWYLLINLVRHQNIVIDLSKAELILADVEKKEMGVFTNVAGKDTWIGVKCGKQFQPIFAHLQASGTVAIQSGKLISSQRVALIVLICLLAILALITIANATATESSIFWSGSKGGRAKN